MNYLIPPIAGIVTGFILGWNGIYFTSWKFWAIIIPVVTLAEIIFVVR